MNRIAGVALLLLLAGCQSAPAGVSAGTPTPFKLNKRKSVEITPSSDEFTRHRTEAKNADRTRGRKTPQFRAEIPEGELHELPKFTVTQKGFRNLGLSVVTNTEVLHGGNIEWMRVGVVLPGTPAARKGLHPGMEILAINNILVSYLTREQMLHLLFERESGMYVRLLVNSRSFGLLPHFVTL